MQFKIKNPVMDAEKTVGSVPYHMAGDIQSEPVSEIRKQLNLSPALPPNAEDCATQLIREQCEEDDGVARDSYKLPPIEEIKDGKLQPIIEVQQNAFEAPASTTPKSPAPLDLAKIPPELREIAAAAARGSGAKIENEHLLGEKKKEPPANAMSLDFGEDAIQEAQSTGENFRVSRRKDLDVLFDGLPVGPQFQEEIVKDFTAKLEKEGLKPSELHFVIYVYLALAIPNDKEAEDSTRWATGPVSPIDFNRLLPKEVRNHFKMQILYRRNGSRADAVWYRAIKVSNSKEATEASPKAMALGKQAGAACEMILEGTKDSGYAKNILETYKVE